MNERKSPIEILFEAYLQSNHDGVGIGALLILDEAKAEYKTLRARLHAAAALVVKWQYLIDNKPIIEEQAIAMARCTEELEATLKVQA